MTESEDIPKKKEDKKEEKSSPVKEKVNSEMKKSFNKDQESQLKSPESKKKERIEEKSNNDIETNSKKGSILEKLNPNIRLPLTNILNSNPVVKRILTKSEGNSLANKLKNFEISNDEDDIYFANNHNHYSNLVDDEKEEVDRPKREDTKKEKKSYLEEGKYKDIKVPQKYNNYSSNLFKNSVKK